MNRFAATHATHPRQTVSLSIDAAPDAPTEARALVDALDIELDVTQRYDLRLALTELVANSVVHGSTRADDRLDVEISLCSGVVRCEITECDAAASLPKSRERGLLIVDHIAARWGTLRDGRSVWFELECGP